MPSMPARSNENLVGLPSTTLKRQSKPLFSGIWRTNRGGAASRRVNTSAITISSTRRDCRFALLHFHTNRSRPFGQSDLSLPQWPVRVLFHLFTSLRSGRIGSGSAAQPGRHPSRLIRHDSCFVGVGTLGN